MEQSWIDEDVKGVNRSGRENDETRGCVYNQLTDSDSTNLEIWTLVPSATMEGRVYVERSEQRFDAAESSRRDCHCSYYSEPE
jgi:hypothetical protein